MIDDFNARENVIARENNFVVIFTADYYTQSFITVTIQFDEGNLTATGKFNYIIFCKKAV